MIAIRRLVAAAALGAVLLVGPAAGAASADEDRDIRTMTWNLNTRNFSPDDWVGVIKNQAPDVVGLQEVCVREAEDLRDRLEEHGHRYQLVLGSVREYRDFNYQNLDDWGALDGECSRNWPVTSGAYGQAVLTKLDVVEGTETNTSLPVAEGEEARGYMAVDLRIGDGRVVRVYNTHLSTGGDGRRRQVETIAADAGQRGTAVVLGDFNIPPDPPQEAELMTPFTRDFVDVARGLVQPTSGNQHTVPGSQAAGARIDYILVRGLAPVGTPETYWVASSDHRPLVVNLR